MYRSEGGKGTGLAYLPQSMGITRYEDEARTQHIHARCFGMSVVLACPRVCIDREVRALHG